MRTQTQNAKFVEQGAEVRTKCDAPPAGSAPRIDELVHAACKPGERAGGEFFQIEGVIVESALCFGVGGEQDLEAAVEQVAFEFVGANASADAVGGFDDLEGHSSVGEMTRAGEASKARTDD